jgi:hypothetical protein
VPTRSPEHANIRADLARDLCDLDLAIVERWYDAAAMTLRPVVMMLRRRVTREREQFFRPFDSPQDPLFRVGLAVSAVATWVFFIARLALGKGEHNPVLWVLSFLYFCLVLPLGVNWLVFGVIGCSIRGFRRGWTGKANSGTE